MIVNDVELLETPESSTLNEAALATEETPAKVLKPLSRKVRNHIPFDQGQRWWKRRAMFAMPGSMRRTKTTLHRGPTTRVSVRVEEHTSLADELMVLSAIRELKRQHPAADFDYITARADLYQVLRNQWFLKSSILLGAGEEIPEALRTNIEITLTEPDPFEALETEKSLYETTHQNAVARAEATQQHYQDQGMKDIQVPIPEYNFQSRWHKSTAYLWNLSDQLGLPTKLPEECLAPFGALPSRVLKSTRQQIKQAMMFDRPFVICDFINETTGVQIFQALKSAIPEAALISMQQVEVMLDTRLTTLLTLFRDEKCLGIVATAGSNLQVAWAALVDHKAHHKDPMIRTCKKPYVIEIYQGQNSRWDGILLQTAYTVMRDGLQDEDVPRAVYTGMMYLKDVEKRK